MTSSVPQTAAEKALRERERVWRHYRHQIRTHRQHIYEGHPDGQKIRRFGLDLRRFGAADAAGFLTYVREAARGWLCTADPEIRALAVELIDERIQAIRMQQGQVPIDDPLPGEEDDIWRLCRRELA